jgi:hypothetical protein
MRDRLGSLNSNGKWEGGMIVEGVGSGLKGLTPHGGMLDGQLEFHLRYVAMRLYHGKPAAGARPLLRQSSSNNQAVMWMWNNVGGLQLT